MLQGIKGEHRKHIRELVRRGWTITLTGRGHIRVTHPNGRHIITAATTSDHRAWRNFMRNVRQIEEGKPTS
jgi:hypothetical protein